MLRGWLCGVSSSSKALGIVRVCNCRAQTRCANPSRAAPPQFVTVCYPYPPHMFGCCAALELALRLQPDLFASSL